MESKDRLIGILTLLITKTTEKTITWEASASENIFLVSLPECTVSIVRQPAVRTPTGFRGGKFLMSVRNAEGRVIDFLSASPESPEGEVYAQLGELYELARRQALRIDETLERLRQTLEGA